MTEREVNIVLEDEFGRVQTTIKTELSPPQLMDKIFELKEENEQLKEKLQSVTMLKDDYEELIESFEKKYGKNIEDVVDDE